MTQQILEQKDFALANLEDGTVIAYPGEGPLTVGAPVYVGSLDGEPLSDGTYVLEGETGEFTVEGGEVSAIGSEEEEAEESDSAAEGGSVDVEGLLAALTPYLKDFSAANKSLSEENKALKSRVDMLEKDFAKSPAAAPSVENTPKEFSKDYSNLSP